MRTKKALIACMAVVTSMATLAVTSAIYLSSSPVASAFQVKAEQTSKRIWVVNNDNWWTNNIALWDATNSHHYDMQMMCDDFEHGLLYADVPVNCAKIVLHNTENDWNMQTYDIVLKSWGEESDVVWLNSGNDNNHRPYSYGAARISSANFAWLLSKIDSCDASYVDGYNAYPQLYWNFVQGNTNYSGSTNVRTGTKENGYDWGEGLRNPTIDEKLAYLKAQSGSLLG